MMKKIIILLSMVFSNFSYADDFSVKMWSALSGTSDPNIYFFYTYLTDKYKQKPTEQYDSFWFKGKQSFYGINSESVFISNGNSIYNFIGIVLDGNPKEISEKLSEKIGIKFSPIDEKAKYPTYVSLSGTEILWDGQNKSKLVYKLKNHKYKFNKQPF